MITPNLSKVEAQHLPSPTVTTSGIPQRSSAYCKSLLRVFPLPSSLNSHHDFINSDEKKIIIITITGCPGHTLVHSALPGIHSSVYSCCILPKQLFLTVVGLQHANCMYIRHTTKCSDYYFIKYSSISIDCLHIGGSLLNSKT